MMLTCQNEPFHTGLPDFTYPLPCIQFSGLKNFRRFSAVTPLTVCECIYSKVNECVELSLLVTNLTF